MSLFTKTWGLIGYKMQTFGTKFSLKPPKLFRFAKTGTFLHLLLNPGEDFCPLLFQWSCSLLLVATFGNTFSTQTGKILHKEGSERLWQNKSVASPDMYRHICHFAMIKGRKSYYYSDQYISPSLKHYSCYKQTCSCWCANTLVQVTNTVKSIQVCLLAKKTKMRHIGGFPMNSCKPENEWNPHLWFIDSIDSLQPNVSRCNFDFAGVINQSFENTLLMRTN